MLTFCIVILRFSFVRSADRCKQTHVHRAILRLTDDVIQSIAIMWSRDTHWVEAKQNDGDDARENVNANVQLKSVVIVMIV